MDVNAFLIRSKNLIINPEAEWKVIASEDTKANAVMLHFVLPYLVLNFAASICGGFIFSDRWFFNPIGYALAQAITSFLVYIIVLYITPIIIKALGTSFGTETTQNNVFKLVAYSFTPAYIIGILVGLVPMLGVLGIVGLYSFYIMWHGFGALLKTPEDKKTGFFIVSILIIIGEYIVLGLILSAVLVGLFVGVFFS